MNGRVSPVRPTPGRFQSARVRRVAAFLFGCLCAIVLSQFWLARSASEVAICEYMRVGGGSAAGCGRPKVSRLIWRNLNQFVVAVDEDCSSPLQGEGMKIRLKWGLGGWHVLEFLDWYVV